MAILSEKPKARIVIEQNDDGTWAIISFVNGAQQVEQIQPGLLEFQVRDALQEQVNRHRNAAERAARLAAEKAEKLHRKVWTISAATPGQGTAFANRVIGPIPVDRRSNPSAKDKVLNPMDLL
jgi:hypothetical protein